MFDTKAELKGVKAKVVLAGPSGSGKTYSALRLATGLANGGKIAMIDTEGDRGLYYANKFSYYREELNDFSPEGYVKMIKEAEKSGIDVLIIDSISHEWKYILKEVEKIPGSNSFTKWGKINPRHEKFVKAILDANIHIIATCRAKDKYVLEENDKGKQVPKKVGLGLEQRDALEYEYTVVLNIDVENNVARHSKDNTGLFGEFCERITEKHGELLLNWAEEGFDPEEELIGLQKANILENFLQKKKVDYELARKFIKAQYSAQDFQYLKYKDSKEFNAELINCGFDINKLIEKIK